MDEEEEKRMLKQKKRTSTYFNQVLWIENYCGPVDLTRLVNQVYFGGHDSECMALSQIATNKCM